MTLEINERQVIENLNLYREAMHSFLDLGFTFAIDDVGAGYSGLETMATLGASYLKIDMGLVRDVHQKRVSQQVVKAILEMGEGVGRHRDRRGHRDRRRRPTRCRPWASATARATSSAGPRILPPPPPPGRQARLIATRRRSEYGRKGGGALRPSAGVTSIPALAR